MAVDRLVHANYPVEYFSLENVDRIIYPQRSWWASRQRYASINPTQPSRYLASNKGGERTSEYLEIDLGRVRQINFLTMRVFKVPVNITIEYDVVSAQDGTHAWKKVTPLAEMEYDSKVRYRPDHKNPYEKCNFYFTDAHGNMVNTRYLRIKFARVDAPFPTRRNDPLRYAVMVKGLRTARLVSGLSTTVGPIFNSGIDGLTTGMGLTTNQDPDLDVEGATEIVKQNFVVPESARRGAIHSDEEDVSVFPAILGAGVLLFNNNEEGEETETPTSTPKLVWEIRDVTDSALEVILRRGQMTDTPVVGRTWVDFYFNETPIEADPTKVYQLRVYSADTNSIGQFYQHTPNNIPGRAIPGTLAWVTGSPSITTSADTTAYVTAGDRIMKPSGEGGYYQVLSVNSTTITLTGNFTGEAEATGLGVVVMPMYRYTSGAYAADYARSLTMRLWGDVADSGRDVLGNDYRYATHRDKAENVFDGTRAGWVSAPMPDPNAVESLYFDVRTVEATGNKLTVIDALKVSPLISGVTMHVYYCDGWLNSRKPANVEEWENLLWKPVPWTFQLRSDQQFNLPTQVAASFIKFEFTNLKPRPFRIPRYPELPPVHYRRYPTWVESQFENAQVRRVVNDWFVKHRTKVMRNVLKTMDDPLARFQYKLREFLAALALGKIGRKESAVKEGLVDLKKGAFIDPTTAGKIYVDTKSMYRGTLKVNLDQDSLLGQIVASTFDPRIVGDPVEGEVNFSDSAVVPIVSSINDRVTFSYAHLAQAPMWFNRPARHRYRKDVAKFNKKAYFAGVAEVSFLRSDFTVARDDEVISETFADQAMIESNTFDLEAITAITSGQGVYVSYELPNPGFVQDEFVTLTGTDQVRLEGTSAEPAINVRVFELPNYQGKEYILGEDFDLSFDTDSDGKTINFIERNTAFLRTTVRRPVEGWRYIDVGMVVGKATVPIIRGYEDANTVIGRAVVFAAVQYTDAGTATGIGIPIRTFELKSKDDAATVTGLGTPITTAQVYQRTDAATAVGISLPSAGDLNRANDPAVSSPFTDAYWQSDNFNRSTTGWGTASSGVTWSGPSNSGSNTNGAEGLLKVDTGTTFENAFMLVTDDSPVRPNMKINLKVKWDKAAATASQSFWVIARSSQANANNPYYALEIKHNTGGTVDGRLWKRNGSGVLVALAASWQIAASYTPGTTFKVRLEVESTNQRAKVWLDNTVEPSAWGSTATDSEITAGGYPGLRVTATGSSVFPITYTVEDYILTTDASPAAIGVAVPSGAEAKAYTESGTVTGVGVVSAVDNHGYMDSGTKAGVGVPSGADVFEAFDG